MRNLVALALVVAAVVYFNRSCQQPGRQAARGPDRRAEQVSGGAVRQLERAPTDLMQMGDSMPQAGGGGASKAMLDAARGAGK